MDPDNGPSAWHVYAVDWTPDAMTFYVDDREVYRASRATVESHGAWAFDNKKYLILNFALGGTYPQSVNKADAPYPGLPGQTVASIKAERVQVLVDWVRVVAQ
jgi:beta-glucanase (GH16 family)